MELKDINISPWILEKEGNSFRLRKYFKTSEDLGDYLIKDEIEFDIFLLSVK